MEPYGVPNLWCLFGSLRYVATKAPIFCRRYFMFLSNWQIVVYIAGIWILPAVLFFGIFSIIPNQAFQAEKCEDTQILADVYFRCLIFGLLFAPLFILACLYTALIYLITNLGSGSLAKLQQMHLRRRKRMIGTALLIVCSFLIAWLPGAIWYLLTCPKCPLSYLELQYRNPRMLILISTMANLLMICKGLVNPVIYAWRIPELREAWHRWRKNRSDTWSQRTSYASTAYASIPGRLVAVLISHSTNI